MAKKAKTPQSGDTLNSVAESLGSLLGNAERQWKEWQGPRDAAIKAVTDVRDRAASLLAEMGVPDAVERAKAAAWAAAGGDANAGKKGKKKDKKSKKAKAEKVGKTDKVAKADKAAKAEGKADKKAKKAKKKGTKARAAEA